jgi:hypothetical protein
MAATLDRCLPQARYLNSNSPVAVGRGGSIRNGDYRNTAITKT